MRESKDRKGIKMKHRATSFGSMHTCYNEQGEILYEELVFEREGRGHTHNQWENCLITEGSGIIMIKEEKIRVTKGQWCHIPPGANHWMIPSETPFKLTLTYSHMPSQKLPLEATM